MTFAPLTADRGAELLTWYLADSRARTSAQPEKAQESTASDPACGAKWHESSVRYDRASSSWKTHRSLWEEDLPWSSVTLPKWGSMRDGVCWERMMSERPTGGTDAGLWPTPRSCSAMAARITPESAWNQDRFPNLETMVGREMWPTPTQDSATERRKRYAQGGMPLTVAVAMWPTPMASDGPKCPSASLPRAVQQELKTTHRNKIEGRNWPSPGYSDYKSGTGYDHGDKKQTPQLRHLLGGKLNPTWVEWLMGWPLAWTDLKPLATDRCHSAPPQPGESLPMALNETTKA
jgi:hypothetical protein